ncbi:threonine synthase-like 2 [Strongylocentrotus purpuratus]|uniref:Threonine synthase-like 2 n=1 Tax=Strongylocentrotus purpuratus TaxID=7668 RepID=A0A7M7NT40_STRPU|nr:threonine synthase-like 2 [Strongylocentrotus purpuratus]
MKYVGTRSDEFGKFSFEEAIFSPGYLPDGGLLIPEVIPELSASSLQEWSSLSYAQLCKKIFPLFVGEDEVPTSDLNDIVDQAVAKLKHPKVSKVTRLSNGLNVAELFHTRTLAFKDLSMVTLGQFMKYFLAKRKKNIILIVGTSGDTGSAAIEAIRDHDYIDFIVLVPHCSRLQKLSMFTAVDRNIHIFHGPNMSSDDCDVVIKPVMTDTAFKERHELGTLNSINWGRVMGQIVNYFFTYFSMCPSCDKVVEMVIPTGACGNMTGACIAKKMGLPIKIVCAVNSNDIVHRTFGHNDYSTNEVKPTISPAMDIQIPYNVERVMWLFSGGDRAHIKDVMSKFEKDGKATMDSVLWKKIRETVSSYSVDDDTVKETIRRCWKEESYALCPHTAIAVAYYYHKLANPDPSSPSISVCLATASPAKFPEAMEAAGLPDVASEEVDRWLSLPARFSKLLQDGTEEKVLRARIEGITAAREAGLTGDLYESGHLVL